MATTDVIGGMQKRKPYKSHNDPFTRYPTLEVSKTVLNYGDIFKVKGKFGGIFKFNEYVVNPENNIDWVSCFRVEKGIVQGYFACRVDQVCIIKPKKPVRKRRPRKKIEE